LAGSVWISEKAESVKLGVLLFFESPSSSRVLFKIIQVFFNLSGSLHPVGIKIMAIALPG
jgi:hypothetical protein